MLQFYFHHTPNPMKVALFLEEAGVPYQIKPIDTFKGEQHQPEYLAINPNAKLPAIKDGDTVVFDSNAILLYLGDKHGQFVGTPEQRGELLSWLMFIATGVGPYSGQCVHFTHMAPESPYAINRYRKEVERHYGILNDRLAKQEWLVGDDYSIVDMAAWGWLDRANFVLNGEDVLADYPHLKAYFDKINNREAVARARNIGNDVSWKTDFDEETQRALFPQNY